MRDVSEDTLKLSCASVPDFDTFGMRCDKSIEDRVV